MLYKKYHRNFIKKFKKGVLVEFILEGSETKVINKYVVSKEPHIECGMIHCFLYPQKRPGQVTDQILVTWDGVIFNNYINAVQKIS